MIEPEPLQQVNRTYVRYRQRKLSYYSGCDYFRLSSHPRVMAAIQTGLEKYGLNVAASRLTTGNHQLYHELEAQLADFFDAESALLVSCGYVTNLVAAQALAGHFSHAVIDAAAHPSLADAARLLDCPVLQFKSRDPEALAGVVVRCGPGAKLLLLTDGMFSSDGSAAPLAEYLKILPKDGLILVDDAHGAGVLGRNGQGAPEHAGVSRRRIIQTVTLSKSFGAYGGAILGSARFRQQILDRSRMFVGSTPLPLPLANAALAGIRILKDRQELKTTLDAECGTGENGAAPGRPAPGRNAGTDCANVPAQPARGGEFESRLAGGRTDRPFIKYPGGPPSGYFRFVISSEHSQKQLDTLIGVLRPFARA